MTDRLKTLLHDEAETLDVPPVPGDRDPRGRPSPASTSNRHDLGERGARGRWSLAGRHRRRPRGRRRPQRSARDGHSGDRRARDARVGPRRHRVRRRDGRRIAGSQDAGGGADAATTPPPASWSARTRTAPPTAARRSTSELIGPDGRAASGRRDARRGRAVDRPGAALPRLGDPDGPARSRSSSTTSPPTATSRPVDVPGTFTWGGWEAPPVVALRRPGLRRDRPARPTVVELAHRRGAPPPLSSRPARSRTVCGGRTVTIDRGTSRLRGRVVDATTGRRSCSTSRSAARRPGRASPPTGATPGRQPGFDPPDARWRTTSTAGDSVQLPVALGGYGWTSDGDQVFAVRGLDRLDDLQPTSGTCDATSVPTFGQARLLRYAGRTYES